MRNPTEYSREQRTLRVTLDLIDFERVCAVAHRMGATPTALAAEAIVHVVDELAGFQMEEEAP